MTPVLALTLDRGAVIPAIPADWADRVQVTPDAVRVSGCPVGSHPIYTHVGGDGVLRLARSAGPLLEAAAALGQSIRLSPTGLTFLLGYCLTPFPFTVFEGVAVLGDGDGAGDLTFEGALGPLDRDGAAVDCDVDAGWHRDRRLSDAGHGSYFSFGPVRVTRRNT